MGIGSSGITISNIRFRFFIIFFMGAVALASVWYWRSQTLVASNYVPFPIRQASLDNNDNLRSKNYQIEVRETSPSVK